MSDMAISAVSAYKPASFIPDTPLASSGAPKISLLPDNGTNDVTAVSAEGSFANSLKTYMKGIGATADGLDATQEAHHMSTTSASAPGIVDTVKDYMNGVNDKVVSSDGMTRDVLTGKNGDVGAVTAAVEEADLSLDFTLALARRLTATFQTVQQMQF